MRNNSNQWRYHHLDKRQQDKKTEENPRIDLPLSDEKVAGIQKHIHRARPTDKEGAPPPIVVLGAQLKVGQGDGHFGQRDEQQQPHHQQETKDVVVRRAKPNGRHDEIQFNGHGTCRTEAWDRCNERGSKKKHLKKQETQ